MKFFIPAAVGAEQTARVYEAVRRFVTGNMGSLLPRKIFRLSYKHNGNLICAEVGRPEPLTGEVVVTIFASERQALYFICTATRGVARGDPILAGATGALSEDFELSEDDA